MEELILEYINSYCDVTSRTSVSFNGKKIFHSEITKHLIDLFDIEWSVDDILSDCFKRQDPNFNYYCFMEEKRPSLPSGLLFYMDYVYNGANIPPSQFVIG